MNKIFFAAVAVTVGFANGLTAIRQTQHCEHKGPS